MARCCAPVAMRNHAFGLGGRRTQEKSASQEHAKERDQQRDRERTRKQRAEPEESKKVGTAHEQVRGECQKLEGSLPQSMEKVAS